MANNHKININLQNFDGDPFSFDFFSEQFKNIVKINNIPNDEALLLLKSKLAGAASRYYIESPQLKDITTCQEFLDKLRKFFSKPPQNSVLQEFESLVLLPAETIQNLAHRINILTSQVYPNIKEDTALQQIKLVKLKQALPSSLKAKLVEAKVNTFDEAVNQAESLFEQYAQNNILNYLITPNIQNNSTTQQINALTDWHTSTSNGRDEPNREKKRCDTEVDQKQNYRQNRGRYKKFNNYRSRSRQQFNRPRFSRPVCQFCDRPGHILRDCYKFKNFVNNKQNQSVHSHCLNQMTHCCHPETSGSMSHINTASGDGQTSQVQVPNQAFQFLPTSHIVHPNSS